MLFFQVRIVFQANVSDFTLSYKRRPILTFGREAEMGLLHCKCNQLQL